MFRLRLPFAALPALCVLAAGCGPGNDAPIPGAATGPTWEPNERPVERPRPFEPTGPEWAVPVPPARGVVPVGEWEPAADPADDPGAAALDRANRLKYAGRHERARPLFEEALRVDPTSARAAYHAACNAVLAGDLPAARVLWDRATDLGLSDYPDAMRDDELGALRADPDFPDRLREIRERYLEDAAEQVGTAYFVTPADVDATPLPGDAGPPVIFLLHGYGDSNESYLDEAVAWARLGWVAVAAPGSVPTGGGRFVWPKGNEADDADRDPEDDAAYETVDGQLRVILADARLSAAADTGRAYLLGFSQGANYAVELTSRRPGTWAGAVGLSPGGEPSGVYWEPDDLDRNSPRPVAMFYGTEEDRTDMLSMWSEGLRAAGWPVRAGEFAGGHQFPPAWRDGLRGEVAAFLLGQR